MSYTDTCSMPIIMYCPLKCVAWGNFVVVYKQISVTSLFGWRISTFLQNFITVCFFVFELREFNLKKKVNKTPYHHAHPYILSTSVLHDLSANCFKVPHEHNNVPNFALVLQGFNTVHYCSLLVFLLAD